LTRNKRPPQWDDDRLRNLRNAGETEGLHLL
jgi:hypothetical protein